MKINEYEEAVMNLRAQEYDEIKQRLQTGNQLDLLHAAMGLSTEAGEILEQVKHYIFYGKNLDVSNLLEELGDSIFFHTLMAITLGLSFNDIIVANAKKLAIRYPEGFTKDKAINRNLGAEKEAMEPVGYCDECLKQKNCSFTGDFEECNQRYCGHICQTCKHDGPEYKCLVGIKSDNKPITGSTDCSKWEKR